MGLRLASQVSTGVGALLSITDRWPKTAVGARSDQRRMAEGPVVATSQLGLQMQYSIALTEKTENPPKDGLDKLIVDILLMLTDRRTSQMVRELQNIQNSVSVLSVSQSITMISAIDANPPHLIN